MLTASTMKSNSNKIDAPDGLNACLARIQKMLSEIPTMDDRLYNIADAIGGDQELKSAGVSAGPAPRPNTAVSVFVARQIEEDLQNHIRRMVTTMERLERDIA